MANSQMADLLRRDDCMVEAPLLWNGPEPHDHLFKAQIDLFADGWLVDVKTCRSLKSFEKDFWRLGYDLQLYHYGCALRETGHQVRAHAVLACEKEAPYACQLMVLSDEAVDIGYHRWIDALALYEKWEEDGISMPPEMSQINAPGWLANYYAERVTDEDF